MCVSCRLQDGLSTLGVLEALQQHPAALEDVFTVKAKPLTMRGMLASFSPSFSDGESAQRVVEMRVYNHWRQFIQQVEGKCSARNTI